MTKTLQYLTYLFLVLASLTLCGAFWVTGFPMGIPVSIIISIVWGIFIWRNWDVGNNFCLMILLLGISLAAVIEAPRLLILISMITIISTWDLATFYFQLIASPIINDESKLIQSHLLRLFSILILGFSLTIVTFGMQLSLKFWQVFLLGILLLVGLSQVFIQLKRSNSD
jgi:hypothetical protein